MAEKSEQAFRTISEVADALDLPQHVLRFWETKFNQVSPMKRGGGRRYYRPQDVELLTRIKSLLHHEGYTIKGVQRLLSTGGKNNLPAPSTDVNPAESLDLSSPKPADLTAIIHDLDSLNALIKNALH